MGEAQSWTYWRDFIPDADTPRSKQLASCNPYEWTEHRCAEPFIDKWKKSWKQLYDEPYKGITVDGQPKKDIFHLAADNENHGAPVADMVKAAQNVVSAVPSHQKSALLKDIDAPEWRAWMNPELYISRHGVRLEETNDAFADAVHDLLRASLSPSGYRKARGCIQVNHFLGEVVNGRKVLNEKSYNFTIFGTPSQSEPWGWQLFGHHLDLNCFVLGTQMVVSPIFMGAEPNIIDEGPHKGTELFVDQEQTALRLINSIPPEIREKVHIYKSLSGPEYPEGRYHRADQRHLGGAFQDNRTIPYEGCPVTSLPADQQDQVRTILRLSLNHLPPTALDAKMAEIATHWHDTYFAWIGAFVREDGFYYKIHSPVVMIEFDHHSGVFLTNKDPLPFHIHTLVRTPNGNDYGKELLRLFQRKESAVS
jgi:hypothetical protein